MVSENLAERRLKQVSRRVVSCNRAAACVGNIRLNAVAYREETVYDRAEVHIYSVGFLCIRNIHKAVAFIYRSGIADLSAALTVEGCAVKNNGCVALAYAVDKLVINNYGNYLCVRTEIGVAGKFCFRKSRYESF